MPGATTATAATAASFTGRPISTVDSELEHRVRSVCNKFADNVHIIANEPTLACYRLQEHVRRSLPGLVERRHVLARNDRTLEGRVFDLDYDVKAVRDTYPAEARFRSIQEMLKNCIYVKQELDASRAARERAAQSLKERDRDARKMKRFSGSFDVQSTGADTLSSSVSIGEIRGASTTPVPIGEAGAAAAAADEEPRAVSLKGGSPKERSGSVQIASSGSYKSSIYYRISTPTK